MNLRWLRLLPVVVFCLTLGAQDDKQPHLWAAIGVVKPVFQPGEMSGESLSFAIVNDGAARVNPQVESSHLLINGTEPQDWGFVITNGIRGSSFYSLAPGELLSFGYQLGGRYFGKPGIYTVRWEGPQFRSAEITFRVLAGKN